ncbi:MAG: hypothetical protein HKM89_13345 [Gemmatimonadales bacterium]|nr:hypothetical protein [Gemmatimonadales bacterium]
MNIASTRLRGWWNSFWFAHGSPLNLAMARVLVATQALWVVLSRDFAAISGLPPEFFSRVDAGAQWRFLIFPGHPGMEAVLQWAAVLALLGALFGVGTRISCFIAGMLLYHLAPFESIIWLPYPFARGLTLPVVALVVLSFARSGDRLALVRPRTLRQEASPALDYSWQLRLIQLLLAQVYLFSAIAKLKRSGFAWVSADNVRRWIVYLVEDPDFAVYHSVGLWIADHPGVAVTVAALTLVLELGFVLVLFSPIARRILVPAAFALHIGIAFSMNLTFVSALLLLVFVNWDWVGERLGMESSIGELAPEPVQRGT